ncbi:hypothetical protein RE9427_17070 [Prescottella equi]|nr:hypothetical protein RE9427_17070 [Prescottella equi]
MQWLAYAGLAAVIGIALTVVSVSGGSVLFAFVGWALAGLLAFGMLALFTTLDTRKRAMPVYARSKVVERAYGVAVAVAFVGVVLGAWSIADWAGRL